MKICPDICPTTLSAPQSSQCPCLFFGADNVCGQISKHISALNGGYCLYNPLCSKVAHKLIKPPAALKFQHIAYLTFPVVSWSITPSCFWKAEMEGWKKTSDELSLLGYYYISYHVTSHITWKYFHKFRSSNLFFSCTSSFALEKLVTSRHQHCIIYYPIIYICYFFSCRKLLYCFYRLQMGLFMQLVIESACVPSTNDF